MSEKQVNFDIWSHTGLELWPPGGPNHPDQLPPALYCYNREG